MSAISRLRLRFVTSGFLAEMRKAYARDHPGLECPVKNLEDYSPEHRSALMAAIEKSIALSEASSDTFYELWRERQSETSGD
jgi:hypothetical protein